MSARPEREPEHSTRAADPRPLLERVRALAPLVESEAQKSERRGTLSRNVVDALAACGVFRMLLSRDAGGEACQPWEAIVVIEELARQDASVGWCSGTASLNSAIVHARVAESALGEIFRDAYSVCAGTLSPFGTARRVEGGYLVNGRFKFGSGIGFATTVTAGCVLIGEDQEPTQSEAAPHLMAICARPEEIDSAVGYRSSIVQPSNANSLFTRRAYARLDCSASTATRRSGKPIRTALRSRSNTERISPRLRSTWQSSPPRSPNLPIGRQAPTRSIDPCVSSAVCATC